MKPEALQGAAVSAAAPPREQVGLALARVEGSASFRSSRRHRHLLRHLVERALAADTVSREESVLAVEVVGRDPGRIDEPDATMKPLFAEHGPHAVSPDVPAIVAARCGRRDEAFERLHEAIDRRDPNAVIMRGDPSFDMLGSDSRWPALIAALGRQAARTPSNPRRTHGTDVVHQGSR